MNLVSILDEFEGLKWLVPIGRVQENTVYLVPFLCTYGAKVIIIRNTEGDQKD